MTTYGANPDELAQLGATLRNQIEAVNAIIRSVDAPLTSTNWSGPARERFLSEWNGSFKQALGRLNEAFDAAGTDCSRRADALRTVMGAG